MAKCYVLSVESKSIVCQGGWLREIIDLRDTDKSQNVSQPWPIIVNYMNGLWDFNSSEVHLLQS